MPNGTSPPRHYCDHPDCGKSFRRAEHLTRHKLNHTNSTIPCPQCDRLFFRRDLLHRHLTLKHGRASRPTRGADPDHFASVDGNSPTAAQGNIREAGPSAPLGQTPFNDNAQSDIFPSATLAGDVAVNGAMVDETGLPLAGNIFSFTSPNVDLAQDWGWLHQSPLPNIPVSSDRLGPIDPNNGVSDFPPLNNDWMNPSSNYQDLYISPEVYDFLINLAPIVESAQRFTAQDVSTILNNAFQFVMGSLPIFHQPTFGFDLVRKELCASFFCVGLLLTREPVSFHIGCALLGQTRSELLQYVNCTTIYLSDLQILQAMLLVEFSGMYLADRTAMELSDIFHGTLITLCRRLGLFEMTPNTQKTAASMPTDDGTWQDSTNAAEDECAKRLAYFVFILDVEQALFFGHERSISSLYSLKLDLPSEDGNWQLLSQAGQMNHPRSPYRIKYHQLCHNLLAKTEEQTAMPPYWSQFSSVVVLLGLASVVLDLLRRQSDPFFDTKQALSRLGSVLPAIHSQLMVGPEGQMKTHGQVVYHITVIALCTPLDDLERAANDGFSRTGRTPKQHTRAAIIRLLTKHKVGPEPARHAVQLLKLFLVPTHADPTANHYAASPNASPPTSYSPYEPSALYLGVLTLWAYIIGRVSDNDVDGGVQMQDHPYMMEGDAHPPSTSSSTSQQTPIIHLLSGLETAIDKNDNQACRSYWRTIVQHVASVLGMRRNNNAQEYSQVLGSLSDNLNI